MPNKGANLRVLLVGAGGVFGRLLAQGLMREPDVTPILAGRTASRLEKLRGALGGDAEITLLDRNKTNADQLRSTGADVVVDAAGPFQDSGKALIEAAIEAGCHYIDLADGRSFVLDIRRFDTAARARGVLVLSGASSTPALSQAVLDDLTAGWSQIDTIRIAISPGNRAPRGLSVVRSILSYAGQPVRVFRQGGWTEVPGWGMTQWLRYPGIGPRLASVCETPDLDLLVERYQPRVSAEFFAGLELSALHYGLSLASMAVRIGLVSSLAPFARPARFFAALFELFGSDRGGMIVEVMGHDGRHRPISAQWSLIAEGGKGPYVPTLAALALIRRLRAGNLTRTGAAPCVGYLELADFKPDFDRLGIATAVEISHPSAAP